MVLGSTNDKDDQTQDQTTVTVVSTIGFPDEGVIFIDNEGIYYKNKSTNQFLDCIRGYIGVQTRTLQRFHCLWSILH